MKDISRRIEKLEKLQGKEKTAAMWFASEEGRGYQEALVSYIKALATGKDVNQAKETLRSYQMPEAVSQELMSYGSNRDFKEILHRYVEQERGETH